MTIKPAVRPDHVKNPLVRRETQGALVISAVSDRDATEPQRPGLIAFPK
jgi:hypothetical protein